MSEIVHKTQSVKIIEHGSTGLVWFGGWLFTIGFLQLIFWKGVLAIVLWPYYLGAAFAHK